MIAHDTHRAVFIVLEVQIAIALLRVRDSSPRVVVIGVGSTLGPSVRVTCPRALISDWLTRPTGETPETTPVDRSSVELHARPLTVVVLTARCGSSATFTIVVTLPSQPKRRSRTFENGNPPPPCVNDSSISKDPSAETVAAHG